MNDETNQEDRQAPAPASFPPGLLTQPVEARLEYFEQRCLISHPRLQEALETIIQAICPPGEGASTRRPGTMVLLEYDYPVHVLDGEDEDFVLTGERLVAFYEFVRSTYIPGKQKRFPVSRDYTMIVVAGESGLRADEICHLDVRDLFYPQSCLQTRYGKGAGGSGKRVRKTVFTPFAQETMHVYETAIRPAFPDAKTQAALFLSERGERVVYSGMWSSLHAIAESARAAGLDLPHKFGWHSLRKSFATNFMEEYPEKVWLLMDLMGHLSPGTLFRYVRHSREYFEQGIGTIAQGLLSNTDVLKSRLR